MKWYEAKIDRFLKERMIIKEFYPTAKMDIKNGHLIALLTVQARKDSYLLEIVYPTGFPYEEPKAYIRKPRIRNAKHRWKDGSLCVEGKAEPPILSGKIVIDWSINWIKAYEDWLDGIPWPDYVRGQQ